MTAPPGTVQQLRHASGTTDVYVGRGARQASREALAGWLAERQAFFVGSESLIDLHEPLFGELESLAVEAVRLTVPDGEAAKTLRSAEDLWSAMLDAGGTRDSRVVAIGGGSTSDLAGFVAACFLRGVELGLVPTTLLGQVDAAIGGKTAIDMPQAKNSVGAFWHPRLVIADTGLLRTLDAAELRSGLVEVVKIGAAEDRELFELLEERLPDAATGTRELGEELLETIVRRAVGAKIRVVESDPSESDRRRVLNLGHTLGHAIEAALGYTGLRHGEAVAYGLLFAARLGAERGGDATFVGRLRELLRRLEPPALPALERDDLLAAMRRDKKARRAGVVWVLPLEPGRVGISEPLAPDSIAAELERFLADPWAV